MELSRKNEIKISKSDFGTLCLIKEKLLGECSYLMDENESKKVLESAKFCGEFFPYPFTFAPKIDEQTYKNLKENDEISLILEDKKIGYLKVKSKFKDKLGKANIFTPNICSLENGEIPCLSGEFELYENPISDHIKALKEAKERLNARKITAIISSFDPLHRAHERMFRWTIDKADLVVVFLMESYESNGFDFELKNRCLIEFIKNYLPQDKIFIFPLKDINIFHAHLNPGLESILAKNLGCTKLVVGQNHSGLGMFYDKNQPKSMLDEFSKDYGIEIIILPEFVFCSECRMIVSTRSCPHGCHHHIHYNGHSLKELLRVGLIPPAIFMRKEVSSIILSTLFPKRFKNVQQIYYSLFSTNGILEEKHDEDFYKKMLELHQMSYMV